MTTQLRDALERLDDSIDRLQQVAQVALNKRAKRGAAQNGARNRAEVMGRLDAMIGRLESFLVPEAHDGKR